MIDAGILDKNAGELIAEAALAIEISAEMDDIAKTIHPYEFNGYTNSTGRT